jgi:hypothetical protein
MRKGKPLKVKRWSGHALINRLLDGQAYDPSDAPGDVTFREAGQVHELQNISPSRYVNRLIESKQPRKREE